MEITLIILTSVILNAFFIVAYRVGYEAGRKQKENETERIEINDSNKKILQDYIDFATYTGGRKDER